MKLLRKTIIGALALLAASAYAQPTPVRHPPKYTVAAAPSCVDGEPKLYAVTDAASSASCTVGGGSTEIICQCLDGTASVVGSGGSGGVSDGDKGDITVSGSGATWTLDSDASALASYVPVTKDGQQTITATGAGNDITQTAADTIVFEIAGAKSLVMSSDADTFTLTSTGASDSEVDFVAANAANPNSYGIFGAYSEGGASLAYLKVQGDNEPEIRADEASGMVLVYNGPFRPYFDTAAPASCSGTIDGSLFVDSDTHLLNYCDGSSWGNVRDGGAAATATALAANGANCSAGNYPLGVDASGAAEDCTADDDVPDSGDFGALALSGDVSSSGLTTTIGADKITEAMLKAVNGATDEYLLTYESTTGDFEWAQHAPTASALAANGSNCSAGQYPLGVDASGAVESCTADDDLPDSDEVTESMLKAVDTASDEECLTYETTTGDFEWQSCGSGGIGGSTGSTDDVPLCADGTGGATAGACTQLAAPAGSAGAPAYSFSADPDTGWYRSGTNSMSFAANGAQQFTLGPFVFTFNVGAVVTGGGGSQIYGFQYLVEAKTNGSGSPYAISTSRGQEVFTNETTTAKTYLTLPSAAGGYTFTFIVQDADGLRVTAAAGDDIRIGATTSSTAGYCESTTVGDTVTLVAINATSWYAVSLIGSGWTCA